MHEVFMASPLGMTRIQGDEEGISSISVIDETHAVTRDIPDCLQQAVDELQEYFNGGRTEFDLKLNPAGTPFQKKIWDLLQEIPYGKTISYMHLAKRFGDVKAIRAVAAANGKNPLWVVIPCHRVIGSDGSLTGYAGGLHRKKWLLNHEAPYRQSSLFEN